MSAKNISHSNQVAPAASPSVFSRAGGGRRLVGSGIERLRKNQTRILTYLPDAVTCNIVLEGALLLGGGFTRPVNILVDGLLANAYITFGGGTLAGFKTYDVSNKAAPILEGSITPGVLGVDHNVFTASALSGTVVYAAGAFGGGFAEDVTSLDVSNPLLPTRISSLTRVFPLGHPLSLSIVGTTLYLTDNSPALSVVDITNPAAMATLANYTLAGAPFFQNGSSKIVAVGTLAYISTYDVGTPDALLGIYDVTNPLAVTQLSKISIGTPVAGTRRHGVQIRGTTAYVLSSDQFIVVNVSNSALPTVVSVTTVVADNVTTFAEERTPLFVNLAQTRAYILNQQTRSMYTYDISGSPVLVNTIATKATSSPESIAGYDTGVIAIDECFLFVAETEQPAGSTQGWLEIFDISGCGCP
jgi:hypothetical protein